MLTDTEVDQLWNDVVAAEVRSLYFADLGTRYTRHKQIVSGVSFFLASGAAATIAAHLSAWIPMTMATVTAVLTASSIAVNLDGKAATMAKFHFI